MPFRRTPFTGFPFDDTDPSEFNRPRNSSFRHQLDDIASRHPEFAEHLRPWVSDFPSFRANPEHWGRKRHPSGSCGEDDNRSQASGFSNSSNESNQQIPEENIFDAEFGIPEHLRRRFENRRNPQPPKATPERPSRPVASDVDPEESEKPRRPIPQYGLRNTVDLGQKQKQASFDEEASRGQRSMSAPPDNRTNQSQPRYVSRINIDPLQKDMGSNSSSAPKPPKAPEPQTGPKQPSVRHIPIFVEGRDEPVLPKNVDQEQQSKQQYFSQSQPQQQKYFGRDPNTFTQFVNREPARQHSAFQQSAPRPHQQQQQPQPQYTPPQQPFEAKQQQQVPQRQESPKPQPPPQVSNDPISKIQVIQKDVLELMTQVENFAGTSRKDKQYLYLDEMLTRNLLKLDNIETEGKDNIRQARKEAIKCIEKCISILETKALNNAAAANQAAANDVPTTDPQAMEADVTTNPPATVEEQKLQEGASLASTTQSPPVTEVQPEVTPSANLIHAEQEATMDVEPVAAVPATLEVGGVVKSGSKVQVGDSTLVVPPTESPTAEPTPTCGETPKKKGKKAGVSKKKADQSAETVAKTDAINDKITPMEVESQGEPTSNSAPQDASQSQEAPQSAP